MGGFTKVYAAPHLGALNTNVDFTKLPQWVKDAFSGPIQRVKLEAGTRLYKISSHYLEVPNEKTGAPCGIATPWWKPRDEYPENSGVDSGLDSFLGLARRLNTSAGDLSRVTSAVRRPWNNLTHIITARLSKQVYGVFGRTGWQPKDGTLSLARIAELDGTGARGRSGYPGGGYQFYIPNMKVHFHIEEVQRVRITQILDAKGNIRLAA